MPVGEPIGPVRPTVVRTPTDGGVDMTQDHTTPEDSPEQRAAELRELAGPVTGSGERTAGSGATPRAEPDTDTAGTGADAPPPEDSPDARTNPDVDEARATQGDADVPEAVEDSYGLRSMPAEPNPTDDDPGSYLNT
jgi:hypothetical protein